MLCSSSRRLRCKCYTAAELCNRTFGPDPLPIRIRIPKCTPSPNPVADPNNWASFSTETKFTSNSSEEDEETLVSQILSHIENAPTLLESLHNKRLFLSPKSYNRVLITASERNDLYLVTQIFKVAIASGVDASGIQPLNSDCYLTVAKAFAKTDDCEEALLNFTKEVLESTSPSMTVLNRLLYAFGQCKETEKAVLVFAQVKDLNFAPDLYTYNTVIAILGRAGRTDEMLGLFESMKEAGIDPDLVSYNTVINLVRKFGEVGRCLLYFKEMGEKGVEPDLLTYTAVIDGLGRSGNIDESFKFFCEMKERRIRPSLYLYRAVISNLKKMGKLEMVATVMEEMKLCASKRNKGE
ncbi:hypothetical protein M0R45_033030 [Rubus argutus]|uniref:Pentatricopeptide repeat-containing protein n=1 Tax=Rubus argutus TaxID=59490 RepID=A0AAW1WIS9_RUBAR